MDTDYKKGIATFVMAHWRPNPSEGREHLDQAVKGILNQTDEHWQLVIVDDASPSLEAREYLKKVKELSPERIHVIWKDTNDGPGMSRNIGIEWAYKNNSPMILFNDADDISHPERLDTVRRIFMEDPEAGVVYSTFQVIDEHKSPVPEQALTPSILEILEGHRENPVQGKDAWIQIGTRKGYTNLTSSTAVKTELAYRYPFPPVRVSEDQHAWLRYSAAGGKFVYAAGIPSYYRIPQGTPTVSRARIENYYAEKAEIDTAGFLEAIRICEETSGLSPEDRDSLLINFYLKLAETLGREDQQSLAREQVDKAAAISRSETREQIALRALQGYPWADI